VTEVQLPEGLPVEVGVALTALEELERKELARTNDPELVEERLRAQYAATLAAAHAERREALRTALEKAPAAQGELLDQILQQIAKTQKLGFGPAPMKPNRRDRRAAAALARKGRLR